MRCGRVRLTLFFPLHISNFLYRIENVVCYPFRTANLVDNGTKEGQIGEGCWLVVVDLGKWENHPHPPLPCFQTPYFVDRHFFLKHIQDKESVSK